MGEDKIIMIIRDARKSEMQDDQRWLRITDQCVTNVFLWSNELNIQIFLWCQNLYV